MKLTTPFWFFLLFFFFFGLLEHGACMNDSTFNVLKSQRNAIQTSLTYKVNLMMSGTEKSIGRQTSGLTQFVVESFNSGVWIFSSSWFSWLLPCIDVIFRLTSLLADPLSFHIQEQIHLKEQGGKSKHQFSLLVLGMRFARSECYHEIKEIACSDWLLLVP